MAHALYFPWIEPPSDAWLMTSVLYWDRISTIVPRSRGGYQTEWAKELHNEGILHPYLVDPHDVNVRAVEEKALDAFTSPAVGRALAQQGVDTERIHPEKLSDGLRRALDELTQHGVARQEERGSEWRTVPAVLASVYMDMLAHEIAANQAMALISDSAPHAEIAATSNLSPRLARLFSDPMNLNGGRRARRYGYYNDSPLGGELAEALLVSMVLRGVHVQEGTELRSLLNFRDKRQDELRRFQAKIRELSAAISDEPTVEAMVERARRLADEEIEPAIADLQRTAKECGVMTAVGALRGMMIPSAGYAFSGALGQVGDILTGGLGTTALVLTGALSVAAQVIPVVRGALEERARSPWTYVLGARRTFGR